MLIETKSVIARANVSLELVDQPGAIAAVSDRIVRAVIAEGETIGATIHERSCRIVRGEVDTKTFTIPFTGYWCPDPMLGVEFLGGPHDGKVLRLSSGEDGRPLEYWVIPNDPTMHETYSRVGDDPPTVSPQHVRYRRAGIHPVMDRWVYVADSR